MSAQKKRSKTKRPGTRKRREWDRMTALLELFVLTGSLADMRPASILLVSEPGSGKTELLDRFKLNPCLSYHSDLTWKGLLPVLRRVRRQGLTHLVLTEFQKLFQRKQSVAENCLGTIVQAMEEGVGAMDVGGSRDMGGIRLGLIGAVTHGTMTKRREYLNEIGFLSRSFVIPWEPPDKEISQIMDRITHGDRSDMEPVIVDVPTSPIPVTIPVSVGKEIKDYAWAHWKADGLRPLMRFRALTAAAALRYKRRRVIAKDWHYVKSFADYWDNTITE